MHPVYFILIGFVFLMGSGILLVWTTVFRSRTTPEPGWVFPVGLGTWAASFIFFFIGLATIPAHLTA